MIWLVLYLVMAGLAFAIAFWRVRRHDLRRYSAYYATRRFPGGGDLFFLVVVALVWPAGLPVILMVTRKGSDE